MFAARTESVDVGLIPEIADFEAVLRASRPKGYADYLYYRHANPSFLGALPPLVVLSEACEQTQRRRFVELLCGTGHASAVVQAVRSRVETIMADIDFVNLYVAHRFVSPDSATLCVDVELPLPLASDSVDAIFCLDGLHYVRSKAALLSEVDRVIGSSGAWLFSHMHNADAENVNPGVPLDTTGYRQRFQFGRQRMLPETQITTRFRRDGGLDLAQQALQPDLEASAALALMGARDDSMWRHFVGLDRAIAGRPDLLSWNPILRLEPEDDGLVASAAWPSDSLRLECTREAQLFDDAVHVPHSTLLDLAHAKVGGPVSDEVLSLIRAFVLVCLPACYPREGVS